MNDIPSPHSPSAPTPESRDGLQLFADGSCAPDSRRGGWALVAYRDGVEVASRCGGAEDAANNRMEVTALLQAMFWLNANAAGERAVIWSDSVVAVKGCNDWRPIWRNNGWKKITANPKLRSRVIQDADLWQAIDRALAVNAGVTVMWCKGHAGIGGNERADGLAEQGRRAVEPS
jgi:ribonuclease HI